MRDSQYRISGQFTGASSITQEFGRIYEAGRRAGRGVEEGARIGTHAYRQFETTLNRVVQTYSRFTGTGREIFGIWQRGTASLRQYTDEAMRLIRAQEKFKGIGLAPEENERAFAAVKKTVESIRGLNLADTMETLSDVHTGVGELSHAIAALPSAAKYRFGFETIFGDKFSKEQIEEQVQAAFKYLEATGAVAKGEAEMERRFNVLAQMVSGSIGRTTPSMMLQFARRAGPSGQGLSVEGMRNMSALVQELGGEGAGTALMSMYQSLVAGVMKQPAVDEFARLGLMDMTKIKTSPHHPSVIKFKSGANKLGALMQEDPLKAADALMEAMRKPLHGKPIDTTNMDKVREELAILFGNRTAQKMMSILATQRGQVVKEAHLAAIGKDIQQLYDQALSSPQGKLMEFENAWKNLQAVVGGPMAGAFTDLASAALPVVRILAEHPKLTLWVIGLLKFGRAAAQTAAAIRMSGIVGLIKSLFGFGGARAGAGIASATAGAITRAEAEAMLFGGGTAAASAGGLAAGAAFAGAAALAIGVIAMAINNALENQASEERAAQAGERIGQYLRERFTKQIEGKLSAEVQKELDKAAAPALAKDIVEMQGLSTASEDLLGPNASDLVVWLRTHTRPGDKATYMSENPSDEAIEYEKQKRFSWLHELRGTTGIVSASQLDAYLRQAQQTLTTAGKPELYPVLERLARDAFPQFETELDKMRKVGPAAEDVTSAFKRLSSTAGQLTLFPPPGGSFTQPLPKLFPKKGEIDFSSMHGNAYGGFAFRPQLSELAFRGPEAVLPMEHYATLMEAARARGQMGEVSFGDTILQLNGVGNVDHSAIPRLRRDVGQIVDQRNRSLEKRLRDYMAAS